MDTNLITTILASLTCLSIGYWAGQKIAKQKAIASEISLQNKFDSLIAAAELRATLAEAKITMFEDAKEVMSNQFKALASDILDQKAQKFSEVSKNDIGNLLDPVKLQLNEFKKKVEDLYDKEGKDRTSLRTEIESLVKQSKTLSDEAQNLTKALSGKSKAQGNWGEIVLERVLEDSGLRKGQEFTVQESHKNEEGANQQPDVIIRLPEGRHLIVDSKVSLTAYKDLTSAETETDQKPLIKAHLESVRNHIRGLSNKNYQSLYGLNSLDFVLMFVPVEPAFITAVNNDKDLFKNAWDKNVLLVSPSTLLFVLRTVAHLWRQEAQSNNAQEIAKRGAILYDKFVGFTEDIDSIGDRIRQAQDSYLSAKTKLTGNGGLVRQAELLQELGVKPTKSISKKFIPQTDQSTNDLLE